jgi:hypothetical protein
MVIERSFPLTAHVLALAIFLLILLDESGERPDQARVPLDVRLLYEALSHVRSGCGEAQPSRSRDRSFSLHF